MKLSVKDCINLSNIDKAYDYREFFEAFGKGGNYDYKTKTSTADAILDKIDECILLRETMFAVSDIPKIVSNWICNRITENLNELEDMSIINGNDNSLEEWVNMYN